MDNSTIWLCIVVPVVLIVLITVSNNQARAAREKALREARDAYDAALTAYKARPSDPNRRQLALEAGRHYSNVSRDKQGVTMFDEVALKNDLDAAGAGAAAPSNGPPATDTAGRLRRLDELKAQGLVNEAEYEARRQKIIDED